MAGLYAGDISPDDAMDLLSANQSAVLVDVRTRAEWQFVGVPDLSAIGKQPILVEWQSYPAMVQNEDFTASLNVELARLKTSVDAPILFLCRSGARSRAAAVAATLDGHTQCFNVSGGFEGAGDASGHRGIIEGWKARGLPWVQS